MVIIVCLSQFLNSFKKKSGIHQTFLFYSVGNNFNNSKSKSAAQVSDGATLRNLDHRNSLRPNFAAVKPTASIKIYKLKSLR